MYGIAGDATDLKSSNPVVLEPCDRPVAFVFAGPNWLTDGLVIAARLDVSTHCDSRRHSAVSCTNICIYAAMSHYMAPT